jgi:hypothetical protein
MGKIYPFKIKKDIRDNLLAEKGVDFVPLACREIITVIISLRFGVLRTYANIVVVYSPNTPSIFLFKALQTNRTFVCTS